MKLREIRKQILLEIGNIVVPPGLSVRKKDASFEFDGFVYRVEIRTPIKMQDKIAIAIDFHTDEKGNDLTGSNKMLRVMSFILGAVEEWLKRNARGQELIYILYNPKSEDNEIPTKDTINRRDRIYRMYLKQFAQKYGSEVVFHIGGNVTAKFNPPLKVT